MNFIVAVSTGCWILPLDLSMHLPDIAASICMEIDSVFPHESPFFVIGYSGDDIIHLNPWCSTSYCPTGGQLETNDWHINRA